MSGTQPIVPGDPAPLVPARWCVDASGVPRSERYGDIYHSVAGALPQAHHVFLRGNGLPQRWQSRESFTVCELGFGLGMNFLATWQAWQDDPARCARLHYLAFEAHPFHLADLRRAWTGLPDAVQLLARQLATAWPELLPGLHRLEFVQGALTLTLVFGDIGRQAWQAQACVDAFYLDGFAPRVNPAMWSPRVFGQLRRLAVAGATVATWCSAGQVRRDLQDAGFLVSRVPGFAAKRDMTVAVLRPGLGARRPGGGRQRVAVVGAGLAGAGIAQALALRGDDVSVWDPFLSRSGGAACEQAAGALVPALSPDDDTRSRLSRVGLERAWARWMDLEAEVRPRACGALICAPDALVARQQRAALERLQFPASWVCRLEGEPAAVHAGMTLPWGGLWFARALRVRFVALARALLATPGVRSFPEAVGKLQREASGGWELLDAGGRRLGVATQVVLASARGVAPLLRGLAPLDDWPVLRGATPIAGQLSLYRAATGVAPVPRCVVGGAGYCLPPQDGWAVAGSTYRPDALDSQADEAGHREILHRLRAWLPAGVVPWLGRGRPAGWSGWRLATRDHLPIMGEVSGHPGLWLACAYGSRGLAWSALAGDLLAATLHAEPLPLERELLHRVRVR